MRVTGNPVAGTAASSAVARSAEADAAEGAAAAAPATHSALQSAVLQPAMAALRDLPDFDHERVAQLREALDKGELPFDPAKLAGLIQRFHNGEA